MIVLDASAAVELLLSLPRASSIRRRLSEPGETLHVPHLFDLEVTAAIRRYALRGALRETRAATALDGLAALRATRYPHLPLIERIWQLRGNVTAYDAAYIALAEALGGRLVTTDAALAAAPGHRAEIELHSA